MHKEKGINTKYEIKHHDNLSWYIVNGKQVGYELWLDADHRLHDQQIYKIGILFGESIYGSRSNSAKYEYIKNNEVIKL